MYSALKIASKYAKYFLVGRSKYYLHSPFVYKLVSEVILDKKELPFSFQLEKIRKELLKDQSTMPWTELGSNKDKFDSKRSVSSIAKVAKNKKYASCLARIVKWHQPKVSIELGTCIGLSALYQNLSYTKGKFHTIEGAQSAFDLAKTNIKKFPESNIEQHLGNFDQAFPKILNQYEEVDYIFFDGNHTKEATLRYFHEALPKANNNSLFVFDDIHYSKGMEEAWLEIQNHPEVTLTIDLFFIGLVFFRKEQAKEHFKIRF